MRDFITGLQFLTTIRLWPETEWSAERFGCSVRYFPLIGAVIGILLAGSWILFSAWIPTHLAVALLIIGNILLTGALHCDGFMDTMDGVLSGRSPERMLEIMKDSRVGANGVMAFVCLILLKWSILLDFPRELLPATLFSAPVIGRVAMVVTITSLPYARPQGIGKAFSEFSGGYTRVFATATGFGLISLLGWQVIIAAMASFLVGMLFARFASNRVGGVTGDIYGAVTEITECCYLAIALVLSGCISS